MPCKDPDIRKQKDKEYYERNKTRIKEYHKEHYKKNKEKIKDYAKNNRERINKYKKEWEKKEGNKEKRRLYINNKRKTDCNFRLAEALRSRIRRAIKRNSKTDKSLELLGCTPEFFISYLESKFLPGMSWENYGINGWHMDHIIPCNSFDLSDPEQQKICFHYTNLQPLWAEDNIRKSDRLV